MQTADFIAEFRRVMDDAALPYLWSDTEIVAYLNDAVSESCERALLIEDKTTPAVCKISLVAGQGDYLLHETVIKLKRLTFRGRALTETSVEALDRESSQWEAQSGEPRRYICGQNSGLRIVPKPTAAEDIALTVYRTPLTALVASAPTAKPEVPDRFHMRLLDWVYHRAYLKQDAETFNKSKSDESEGVFTASFGARVDANVQRKQRDRRPHVVRFRW